MTADVATPAAAAIQVRSGFGRFLPAVTVALCAGLLFLVEPLTPKLARAAAERVWVPVLQPDGLLAVHITNRFLDL